jgi:hypothetical protein
MLERTIAKKKLWTLVKAFLDLRPFAVLPASTLITNPVDMFEEP